MHSRADQLESLLTLDLYEAGWSGPDYFGSDPQQVAMCSLFSSLMKKYHNDETDEARDNLALQLFLECNERCKNFGSVSPQKLDEEYIIGEMKNIIYDFFNPRFRGLPGEPEDGVLTPFREPYLLNLSDIAKCFGLGSGSNIGAKSTDFYTKYVNSTMAHTDPALPLMFREAISTDKLWSDVEAFRQQSYGSESVAGSRLSFVPKSRTISRTICTEPILNMFFQKGIGGVLEGRLREVFGINLSDQPGHNAALARVGSTSGKFGTIDLSSASDTISLRLLREILPPEPLFWLEKCRSPKTVLPDGSELELHMISSMGNGYTFPLQTLIFASLVTAAYRVYDIAIARPGKRTHGNFAVFGDDIIVDHRVYSAVVRCLSLLGFRVNSDKSFNDGWFRESCGSDFHQGYNVRGVYIKTLRDDMDFYSAINRLNRWSTTHGILLRRTVGCLRGGCRFIGVPYDEADDAGVKVPLSLLRITRRDANGAVRYLAHVNVARRVYVPSVDADVSVDQKLELEVRRYLPGFKYHSEGLLLCLLAGWLRAGAFGLRSLRRKSVQRRRVCPGWDERIAASGESLEYGERWKMFVIANLVS